MSGTYTPYGKKPKKELLDHILKPFMYFAGIGLVLSIIVHIASYMGVRLLYESYAWLLHIGVFIVWLPAVLISQKLIKGFSQKDFWKAALRGCPQWMRQMVWLFFIYAFINFAIFFVLTVVLKQNNETNGTSPIILRGFSGHWMAFYSAAYAILYSALNVKRIDMKRRCPKGHFVYSFDAKVCEQCGTPLPHDTYEKTKRNQIIDDGGF